MLYIKGQLPDPIFRVFMINANENKLIKNCTTFPLTQLANCSDK